MIEIDLARQLDTAHGPLTLKVTASLTPGDRIALFGASGAGKTTLLRMLAGLTRPDSGRLVVNGTLWFDSARGIHVPPQQRQIGMVFQDYALFPHLSVRGNLAAAQPVGNPARIDELLELTGLATLAERRPDTLSCGQRQRVALARALAREPQLLLLDEALSALDADLRHRLQDELLALHARFAPTLLLVSHDLAEVFRLARRVIRLEAGQVTGDGSPESLFLGQGGSGRLQLAAEVLAVRRMGVVDVASLLAGGQVMDVVLDPDEAAQVRPGDRVTLAAQGFSPLVMRQPDTGTH